MIDSIAENTLPDSLRGFRPGRSTVDMVFTVRQVQETIIIMIHYNNDNNAYCSTVNDQTFETREHNTV